MRLSGNEGVHYVIKGSVNSERGWYLIQNQNASLGKMALGLEAKVGRAHKVFVMQA